MPPASVSPYSRRPPLRSVILLLLALGGTLLPPVAGSGPPTAEGDIVSPVIALGSVRAAEGSFALAGVDEGLLFDQGFDTRCVPHLGPAERNGEALAGRAGGQVELELGLLGCRTGARPSIRCAWRIYEDPAARCVGAPLSTGPVFDDEIPRLRGVGEIEGWVGRLMVELPPEVGRFALVLECRDPEASGARPIKPETFQWTLYTTLERPLDWVSPTPAAWFERATCWGRELAAGADEGEALKALLAGLYRHGAVNWRYGYAEQAGDHHYRFLVLDGETGHRILDVRPDPAYDEVRCYSGTCRCSWRQLVAEPDVCNFGDCYIVSRAFQGSAAVLGIGGLEPLEIYGQANLGFVTPSTARSFDADFPRSVRCAPGVEPCYPYFFGNHSLRLRDGELFDATFDRIYPAETVGSAPVPKGRGPSRGAVPHPDRGPVGLSIASLGQEDLFFDSELRLRYSRSGYGQWSFFDLLLPAPVDFPVPAEGGIHFTGDVDFAPLYPTAGGYYENLQASVQVLVLEQGDYYFKGVLVKGDKLIAHRPDIHTMAITDSVLHAGGGLHTLRLTFSGEEIYRSEENGPWELRVSVQSPRDVLQVDPIKVTSFTTPVLTPEYQYGDFGQQPAHMKGKPLVRRADDSADGQQDEVEIRTQIFVREKGRYAVEGRLATGGQTLVYSGQRRELDTGDQELVMRVPSERLRQRSLAGGLALTVNLFGSRQIVLDSWNHVVEAAAAEELVGPWRAGLLHP